ncbi:hypothetical protein ACFQZZ_19150 [Nocardia sp. GCM10030253]|uniref:hypothetical protein n=1 Tax=Nocardia sp. GCM10030253 TaxID=3273404 RepID=UPI003632839F
MAGTYSNQTDILANFAELQRHIAISGPRRSKPSQPKPPGGTKKQLSPTEAAEIIAKYNAGAAMTQLKVEHHMAKRTVAKVLRENGVTIRRLEVSEEFTEREPVAGIIPRGHAPQLPQGH